MAEDTDNTDPTDEKLAALIGCRVRTVREFFQEG